MVIASDRVDETLVMARRFAASAVAAISGLRHSEVGAPSRFASLYVDWALEQFAVA
jgi:hypothetical protein